MEVYGYVYLVKNLVNGKMYFGITINDFDTRYHKNIEKYTHNEHLQNSIKKYGIENFEINEQFDVAYNDDDLWDLEDMYICLYNTLDKRYGYNKRRSGKEHKGSGRHSEESKRKRSETLKNMTDEEKQTWHKKISESQRKTWEEKTEQEKQAWSQKQKNIYKSKTQEEKEIHRQRTIETTPRGEQHPMYGKHHSEETKHKIRETLKGKMTGEDNPFYGKHHTEESKRKQSEVKKGKKQSEETRRKRSEAQKGIPKSEETRRRMKEHNARTQKVNQYDLGGNFIKTWDSITIATKETGVSNISACCRGKLKQAGGYKWKYAEENIKEREAI